MWILLLTWIYLHPSDGIEAGAIANPKIFPTDSFEQCRSLGMNLSDTYQKVTIEPDENGEPKYMIHSFFSCQYINDKKALETIGNFHGWTKLKS